MKIKSLLSFIVFLGSFSTYNIKSAHPKPIQKMPMDPEHLYSFFNILSQANNQFLIDQIEYNQETSTQAKDHYGNLLLHHVVRHNKPEALKKLINLYKTSDSTKFINAKNNEGMTPFLLAAQNGNTEIAQILLEHGADPNAKNNLGKGAVVLAKEKNHENFIKNFLMKCLLKEARKNQNPKSTESKKNSQSITIEDKIRKNFDRSLILLKLLKNGSTNKDLIKKETIQNMPLGAFIFTDTNGNNALLLAIKSKNFDTAIAIWNHLGLSKHIDKIKSPSLLKKTLLQFNILSTKNLNGENVLSVMSAMLKEEPLKKKSMPKEQLELLKLYEETKRLLGLPNQDLNTLWDILHSNQDQDIINLRIKNIIIKTSALHIFTWANFKVIEYAFQTKNTPLLKQAGDFLLCNKPIARRFLQNCRELATKINTEEFNLVSNLYGGKKSQKHDEEKKSQKQHNLSSKINELDNALFLADLKKVKALVNSNPNIIKDAEKKNSPPLIQACMHENNDANIVKFLLESGADPNLDKDGKTPLIHAIVFEYVEIANLLLKNKADPNKANKDGKTPLMYAMTSKNKKIVNLLLEYKADPNQVVTDTITPLIYAIIFENLEIANLLLEYKADPNKADRDGRTPLIFAIISDNSEIANLLTADLILKHKVDPNKANKDGKTPLMCAVLLKNKEITNLLLKHKADPNKADKDGETSLMCAIDIRNETIAKLLLEHGADVTQALKGLTGKKNKKNRNWINKILKSLQEQKKQQKAQKHACDSSGDKDEGDEATVVAPKPAAPSAPVATVTPAHDYNNTARAIIWNKLRIKLNVHKNSLTSDEIATLNHRKAELSKEERDILAQLGSAGVELRQPRIKKTRSVNPTKPHNTKKEKSGKNKQTSGKNGSSKNNPHRRKGQGRGKPAQHTDPKRGPNPVACLPNLYPPKPKEGYSATHNQKEMQQSNGSDLPEPAENAEGKNAERVNQGSKDPKIISLESGIKVNATALMEGSKYTSHGFHHDYQRKQQKNHKKRQVTALGGSWDNGCYEVQYTKDSKTIVKSLFPSFWTPDQVFGVVEQAMYNMIENFKPDKGKKLVGVGQVDLNNFPELASAQINNGATDPTITIQLVLNQSGTNLITCYPVPNYWYHPRAATSVQEEEEKDHAAKAAAKAQEDRDIQRTIAAQKDGNRGLKPTAEEKGESWAHEFSPEEGNQEESNAERNDEDLYGQDELLEYMPPAEPAQPTLEMLQMTGDYPYPTRK